MQKVSEAAKRLYELDAYHQANKRSKFFRQTAMLFDTPAGLLQIRWDRYGWVSYWLGSPIKLQLRKS